MADILKQTADRSLSECSSSSRYLEFYSNHPLTSYLAHCTNDDCSTFKGDTGNVWVKIDQLAYNPSGNPPWASDLLREQGAKWYVKSPCCLFPFSLSRE
jgi:hypothetical protein